MGKNLCQLSTRFFVASLPQNDRSGSFAEELKDKTKEALEQAIKEIGNILLN